MNDGTDDRRADRPDPDEDPVHAATAAELRLLRPEVRADPSLVRELLDPEFVEFGASGRRWDRETIASALGPGPDGGDTAPVTATGMTGTLLGPGLVHLTYVSDRDGRRALRSSLWRRTPAGWRLLFHQGTPTGPA